MDDEIRLLLNVGHTISDSYIHFKIHSILSYLIKITGVAYCAYEVNNAYKAEEKNKDIVRNFEKLDQLSIMALAESASDAHRRSIYHTAQQVKDEIYHIATTVEDIYRWKIVEAVYAMKFKVDNYDETGIFDAQKNNTTQKQVDRVLEIIHNYNSKIGIHQPVSTFDPIVRLILMADNIILKMKAE